MKNAKVNKYAEALIKKWEGLRLQPYRDAAGLWTVGWGHRLRDGEVFGTITRRRAEDLFLADYRVAAAAVADLAIRNAKMEGAVISLVFNIGTGAFQKSTIRRRLSERDYIGAAVEFPRWCKSSGVFLEGLLRRRLDEQKTFLEGLCEQVGQSNGSE